MAAMIVDKKQVAEHYKCSPRKINQWLNEGMPCYRDGIKFLRFNLTETDAWFEQQFKVKTSNIDGIIDSVIPPRKGKGKRGRR